MLDVSFINKRGSALSFHSSNELPRDVIPGAKQNTYFLLGASLTCMRFSRLVKENFSLCYRMWWTITGNFGNILPIDWSKTYAKQLQEQALHLREKRVSITFKHYKCHGHC